MTGRQDQANKHSRLGRAYTAGRQQARGRQRNQKKPATITTLGTLHNLAEIYNCVLIQELHLKKECIKNGSTRPSPSEWIWELWLCSPQYPQIHCVSFEGPGRWLLGTQLQRLQKESQRHERRERGNVQVSLWHNQSGLQHLNWHTHHEWLQSARLYHQRGLFWLSVRAQSFFILRSSSWTEIYMLQKCF